MHITGCSNVGWLNGCPWKGKMAIGNSLVIGPKGEIVAEVPYEVDAEKIVYTDIDINQRPVKGTDWKNILRN